MAMAEPIREFWGVVALILLVYLLILLSTLPIVSRDVDGVALFNLRVWEVVFVIFAMGRVGLVSLEKFAAAEVLQMENAGLNEELVAQASLMPKVKLALISVAIRAVVVGIGPMIYFRQQKGN